jgi:hypothetical protein
VSEDLRKAYLETHAQRASKFFRTYGCHLVDHTDITDEIRGVMYSRGEDWPWVAKWASEDAQAWSNDFQTLVFEIPLVNLTGRKCLEFMSDVGMLNASGLEYQTWGGRTFVRMWWDDESLLCRVTRANVPNHEELQNKS